MDLEQIKTAVELLTRLLPSFKERSTKNLFLFRNNVSIEYNGCNEIYVRTPTYSHSFSCSGLDRDCVAMRKTITHIVDILQSKKGSATK